MLFSKREIGDSKKALADHNIFADIFVYPGDNGAGNPLVESIVKKYYRWARGAMPTDTSNDYNLSAIGIRQDTTPKSFVGLLEIP